MSDTDQQILTAISVINTYVSGFMFIFGTFGNLLNIITFSCLKTYRSLITSTLLTMASFAGQLCLTFTLGLNSISKWIDVHIPSRNLAICKSTKYIQSFSILVSLTCLCLSSIDRYLMTSRSVRQRQFMTRKRALFLLVFWSSIWMCVTVPYLVYSTSISAINVCVPGLHFGTAAAYLNLIVAICLPITILSIFGWLTWKNLGNTRLTHLNSQVI